MTFRLRCFICWSLETVRLACLFRSGSFEVAVYVCSFVLLSLFGSFAWLFVWFVSSAIVRLASDVILLSVACDFPLGSCFEDL